MNIGELVLQLGIKGTDKTVGALTSVKKGLGEVSSMSLEAKAGLLAAMYALERLFAASGKMGTSLTNFNAVTGASIQTLQQYQYAARQVGVSNEEIEGSFKTLQSAMTKTLMGQGAPSGLARLSAVTGGLSPKEIEDFSKHPEKLIQKLQEYASKETNIGLRNETIKSFGLGENMVAALSRNAFRPEVLKKAPTYSDSEVKSLDKANIAWSNLGNKIQMAVGHFNALHGGKLVSDISKIVDQVLKLVEAFVKLADKLKLFDLIGKAFEGWGMILEGVNGAIDKITGAVAEPAKRGKLIEDVKEGGQNVLGYVGSLGKSLVQSVLPSGAISPTAVRPATPAGLGNKANTQNNNVKIDNHFQHPGTDHKRTADSMSEGISRAFRQMSPQAQGT